MNDIKTVLLLGSGALKIGEAGEFDYSGSQAIKALKEENIRVILVNPNIATIQTSSELADEVYFLPVTAYFVEKIIAKEKPQGILLSFGGQTALNCGIALNEQGVLKKHEVTVLGTPVDAILKTEDRQLFAKHLGKLGVLTARGGVVSSLEQAYSQAQSIGYPVMLRSGFALGGAGSGVAKNKKELTALAEKGLAVCSQIIVEESLYGWKEIEYEVVRDSADNCITVCNMENFDPVGVHTGDSIVIAPSQTLTNEQYYSLRQKSIDIIRSLKIVGECNIQFALHPKKTDVRVIEVNARLSRSSALASKATGYPLAYVAAKLAIGKTLPQIPNSITKQTTAFYEPSLDYIVVKMPRWDLDKFSQVNTEIGSEMKSVGEVMSIARSFEEAVQKAARMVNDGYNGVIDKRYGNGFKKKELLKKLQKPTSLRLFTICTAIAAGIPVITISKITRIDAWFLNKLKNIVATFKRLQSENLSMELLRQAKQHGFSDLQIAELQNKTSENIRKKRMQLGIIPCIKRIDTMAGEFPAQTNYLYLTYNSTRSDEISFRKKRAIVLGCGPYSVGTSVEFDWCAVGVAASLRQRGVESVMINCNPETVSTDFDISDRLYFEELTLERVLDIYDIEKCPLIVSVGGQIPNNLSTKLHTHKVPILGTTAKSIRRAEHRKLFSALLDELNISQPRWSHATSYIQARQVARKVGYPILVRPSFVLSGKAMSILDTEKELISYLENLPLSISEHPLVISQFLSGAQEFDYDGVAQDGKILISAISQHIEGGGVHSGDSTMVFPPFSAAVETLSAIQKYTEKIVKTLKVSGPFNIQFLDWQHSVNVIECNLRSSRSMPLVSKALNVNLMHMVTGVLLGDKKSPVPHPKPDFYTIKVPQFSFNKLRGADPVLRVEMASTGEVAGMGYDMHSAYLKAILSTGVKYPVHKTVFLSLGGARAKSAFLAHARTLGEKGFTIYTTSGTHLFLKEYGIASKRVGKIFEGIHPNAYDLLKEKKLDFLIVIPEKQTDHRSLSTFQKTLSDGYAIRCLAVDLGLPIFTITSSAQLFVDAVTRLSLEDLDITRWSGYSIRKIATTV